MAGTGSTSGTANSDYDASKMQNSELGEATPAPDGAFPPYPPYATEQAPPSVADTIIAGHVIRNLQKSIPKQPARPAPKPARPRGPKATDVKLKRRAMRAHARCLRRHGAMLTDRLEHIAKPRKRNIISLWREHAYLLPPETIARLRSMLDADEPFKPDQAYEYFVNLRKTKTKRAATSRVNQIKKDVLAICDDKRFIWARNATVAFARGVQQRLSQPGRYTLADKMLRLSDIVLKEICGHTHMRTPSRKCSHPKSRFMIEMADKVAIWIDEVLAESDDRMLMMDYDEDDDLTGADEAGNIGFADDFLNMMGGGGLLKEPQIAYLKFSGPMLEAFMLLTEAMSDKGKEELLKHGKFSQSYAQGSDELKRAPDFDATDFDTALAAKLRTDLGNMMQPITPVKLNNEMKDIVNICSNYLSQNAEYNKEKGPAFNLLIKTMNLKPNELLYQKEKAKSTFGKAAKDLQNSKGLGSDYDDPNLSQAIHSTLSKLVDPVTPADLKSDMTETLDMCSKYLSQNAVDQIEKGPAFDLLTKELEASGGMPFTPQYKPLSNRSSAAYTLKSAPGLSSVEPDAGTAPVFKQALHKAVDPVTPKDLKNDMEGVIERCGNYLSAFNRDRGKALDLLLKAMNKQGSKELIKRSSYSMDYKTGATEIETAPLLTPYMPVRDIANEMKDKLANDVETSTPANLKSAVKSLVQDASKYLSQAVAVRSGVAGDRYPLDFLAAVKKAVGSRSLYKYKSFGQTYADAADELKYAGPLEYDPKNQELEHIISAEMKRGVPTVLAPSIATSLEPTMSDAAKHLAKIGTEKGEALDYVVKLMKEQGDAPLGQLQGYQQTFEDGARRIENAPSLKNDKVDKGVYESVKAKLTDLLKKNPSSAHSKQLPGIVDEASKFLSAPLPESEADKRRVLADLMARKGDEIIGQEGLYKISYTEAGKEIMNAPVGVTTAGDEIKKFEVLGKINGVMPDKKIQNILKDSAQEGAAHLTDVIKDRGKALQTTHDDMKKEKDKDFLSVGKTKNDQDQAAGMLARDKKDALQAEVDAKKSEDYMKGSGGIGTSDAEEARRRRLEQQMHGRDDQKRMGIIDGEPRNRLGGPGVADDQDREAAQTILHRQLRSRGGEVFYQQPHAEVSHTQASDWLKEPPVKVDKTVKESPDTGRLHKKFEKKLTSLVTGATPNDMIDTMQDVIIESSRMLSEYFVTNNYQALVREALISEMQRRGNEILIEPDGAAETFFFAAQRLKKAKSLVTRESCPNVAYQLIKTLDDMIKCRSMARKLTSTMKEYIKNAADYLSEYVTKPDEQIEAYVALLGEMEAAGDTFLVGGNIPKSYKDAAAYLRQLTSFDDRINLPNSALQNAIANNLKGVMANSAARGYTPAVLDSVINNSTKLLVSYIKLQEKKTEILEKMVEQMEQAKDNVLLRHGTIRKTFSDGVDILRGKNTDQLKVTNVDPVVARKIQIKLHNLMQNCTPDNYLPLIDDVIEDTTMYLAVHFTRPQYIQVCKCMKNVFVQCELWCDEILRRVARPCCRCSRHVSAQALRDLAPGQRLQISPSSSRAYAPGIDVSITQCPAITPQTSKRRGDRSVCPARYPTSGCSNATTSYLLYSTVYNQLSSLDSRNILHSRTECRNLDDPSSSCMDKEISSLEQLFYPTHHIGNVQSPPDEDSEPERETQDTTENNMPHSELSLVSENLQPPLTVYANHTQAKALQLQKKPTVAKFRHNFEPAPTNFQAKSGFNSRAPIVTTDQMSDWHAMAVSLMWNVQAWRNWIQEYIDVALTDQPQTTPAEMEEGWATLYRRISTEFLQWRQYNNFSRKLTLRLGLRYKDKEIVSPTRATVKTAVYMDCLRDMLDVIDMFYKWTHWLSVVVKETNKLRSSNDIPLHELRWKYFKEKTEEYAEDWVKYNTHWKVSWEQKYQTLTSGWLPSWEHSGPVWVVSACGAVPSGAVAAGVYDGEVTWVARTTHKSKVLPAALHPSKLCCHVYADGTIYHYTKYQVLCNGRVRWVAWRAGAACARAVCVSEGVQAGRVRYRGAHLLGAVTAPAYRCHVVIFGRPFAFNCYELLVHADDDP